MTNQMEQLRKLIKLTGDRAKLDAKANDTYIVYQTKEGRIVKEFANVITEPLDKLKGPYE